MSGLVLLPAGLTAVSDVLTFLAEPDGAPGLATEHHNTNSQSGGEKDGEATTYYFKQKSQTLDRN